jgi:hypothetical protein
MNESRLKNEELQAFVPEHPPRTKMESWMSQAAAVEEEGSRRGLEVVPEDRTDGGIGGRVGGNADPADHAVPLFADAELTSFRERWDEVQASFVDEPREAVRSADSLVASVVQRIEEQFAQERSRLEEQWERGTNVSTEDLRQGLQRYKSLFGRLLEF